MLFKNNTIHRLNKNSPNNEKEGIHQMWEHFSNVGCYHVCLSRGKKITCPGAREKLYFRQDKYIFSPNVRRTSKNSVQVYLTIYFEQVKI